MRFHHSTRRGRNRFSQGGNHHSAQAGGKFGIAGQPGSLSSRWAQLSYCRQTNIHFNRRHPIELPDEVRERTLREARDQASAGQQQQQADEMGEGLANGRLIAGESRSNTHNNNDINDQAQLHSPAAPTSLDAFSGQHLDQLKQLDKLSLAPSGQPEEESMTQHQRQNSVRRSREGVKPEAANGQHNNHHHHHHHHNQETENSHPTTPSKKRPAATSSTTSGSNQNTKLDLEQAREKLIAQVDKHPFWSTKAARRMRLLDLHERQIYIYELTSYCEKRDLEWRYEPNRGGKLGSGPFAGACLTPTGSGGGGSLLRRAPTTVGSLQQSQPPSPGLVQGQQLQHTPPGGEAANNEPYHHQPATAASSAGPIQQMNGRPALTTALSHNSTIQRPQQLPFEIPLATGGQQQDQAALLLTGQRRQHHSHQLQSQSSAASRLRRSCSSATTSPVHGGGGGASLAGSGRGGLVTSGCAVVQSLSSTPIQTANTTTTTPPGSATPAEPRPMPGPELVWSIEPPEHLRPQLFASYVHTSEVPGTSFVKRCHGCDGRGRLKCQSCYGVGYEVCLSCTGKGSLRSYSAMSAGGGLGSSSGRSGGLGARSGGGVSDSHGRDHSSGVTGSMWANADDSSRLGSGRHDEPGGITSGSSSEICANCSGVGQKRCWICAGRSFITCTACAGTGSLRCFLNLNITYTNHRDEVCLNNSDGIIPRDRLKLSSGLLLADEIADRLEPLASGGGSSIGGLTPDGATNSTTTTHQTTTTSHNNSHSLEQVARPGELIQLSLLSAKLLDKHWNTYKQERLIKQRHRVTQIECFKVDWEFRKKRGHFVVYGDERKVYIAKYPFKSICNIT